MNPQTCTSAWGHPPVFREAPSVDSAGRQALDDWAYAPNQSPSERRDLARSRILQSHSDRLDLSDLGLTEIPPLPIDREWRCIDLSNNALPITSDALPALPAGTLVKFDGDRPHPSTAVIETHAPGQVRRAPKRRLEASSTDGYPHAWRAPGDTAAEYARRLALQLRPDPTVNEVVQRASLDADARRALEQWMTHRRPELRSLLDRHPKGHAENHRDYAARLLKVEPRLKFTDLRALTKARHTDIQSLVLAGRAPSP